MLALGSLALAACTGGTRAASGGHPAAPGVPPARIAIQPAASAADIEPGAPVVVTATGGKLTRVNVSDASGRRLPGGLNSAATTWTSSDTLAYQARYTVTAQATNGAGAATESTSTFTTLTPRALAYDAMAPLAGTTVGVGMPIRVYFHDDADDSPLRVTNRDEVARHITVRTSPEQPIGLDWFANGTELHFRPQTYWKAGTQITVSLNLLGVQLADGVYGKRSRDVSFTIGPKQVSVADTKTHQMRVYVDDKLVQTLPASMGKEEPGRYTHNGVHVVIEKKAVQHMDSTTYGLALDAGGYTADVQWAVRISNNGEFTHSAPWSVAQQGSSNVSHGCVNLSPERAKWYYDLARPGDVVEVTGSPVPLTAKDGDIYDWTVPWSQWTPIS
ncbi:MAG: L,D-transpeptidase [Actinobacteria bacterium]|nr:L,D-transpeptidase [Actinomycetota bacterium]